MRGRASNADIVTGSLHVILPTVNVSNGSNKPTIAPLREVLGDIPTYDRTTINAWEDVEFKKAVEATGRRKIIMTALWTEACHGNHPAKPAGA